MRLSPSDKLIIPPVNRKADMQQVMLRNFFRGDLFSQIL